jgi:hypothetical protein
LNVKYPEPVEESSSSSSGGSVTSSQVSNGVSSTFQTTMQSSVKSVPTTLSIKTTKTTSTRSSSSSKHYSSSTIKITKSVVANDLLPQATPDMQTETIQEPALDGNIGTQSVVIVRPKPGQERPASDLQGKDPVWLPPGPVASSVPVLDDKE